MTNPKPKPPRTFAPMSERDKALNDANNTALPSEQRETALSKYRELKKRDK